MDNKEQPSEQSTVVKTVTKSKHPGRVAQGHKLAALMRQRKQELLQNKTSEQPKEVQTVQETVLSSHTLQYSSLAIIGLIAIAAYYFYGYKKPTSSTSSSTLKPQEEIKKKPKIYLE